MVITSDGALSTVHVPGANTPAVYRHGLVRVLDDPYRCCRLVFARSHESHADGLSFVHACGASGVHSGRRRSLSAARRLNVRWQSLLVEFARASRATCYAQHARLHGRVAASGKIATPILRKGMSLAGFVVGLR